MSPDGSVELAQFCTMYAVKTGEGYELKNSAHIDGRGTSKTIGKYPNPSDILDQARKVVFERSKLQRIEELVISPGTAARMTIEGAFTEDSLRRAQADFCFRIVKIPGVWFEEEGQFPICVTVVVSYGRRVVPFFQVR